MQTIINVYYFLNKVLICYLDKRKVRWKKTIMDKSKFATNYVWSLSWWFLVLSHKYLVPFAVKVLENGVLCLETQPWRSPLRNSLTRNSQDWHFYKTAFKVYKTYLTSNKISVGWNVLRIPSICAAPKCSRDFRKNQWENPVR